MKARKTAHKTPASMTRAVFTSDGSTDLRERSGQEVVVLRRLSLEEADAEVGPMFSVKFADGFVADVFVDELDELVETWACFGCRDGQDDGGEGHAQGERSPRAPPPGRFPNRFRRRSPGSRSGPCSGRSGRPR